uniref:fibronectin type III-like domain-contianing protein n=1 Tax=uncultured Sphingomonas sp. TaxID=158754 RepID=UPI00338E1250
MAIDPRLLATFDTASGQWVIAPGRYRFRIGASSRDLGPPVDVTLPAARFGA